MATSPDRWARIYEESSQVGLGTHRPRSGQLLEPAL